MRRITNEELLAANYEPEMIELSKIFNHSIVEAEDKVWRWKRNQLIDWLGDHAPVYTPSDVDCQEKGLMPYCRPHTKEFRASLNLNELWMDLHKGKFTIEEFMKYYMQTGYSVCGFGDVFYQRTAKELKLTDAEQDETVVDYIVRKHKGKVLEF